MGTRGAYGFRSGGQEWITYNNFDSYPTGLGDDLMREWCEQSWLIRNNLNVLLPKMKVVRHDDTPTPQEIARFGPFENVGNGDDYYSLLRDFQGELFAPVFAEIWIDNRDFLNDSLFCEWAYVFNLDDNLFEVYEGFQKSRGYGRYAAACRDEDVGHYNGYYPVRLIKTYELGNEAEWPDTLINLEQDDDNE